MLNNLKNYTFIHLILEAETNQKNAEIPKIQKSRVD